MDLLEPFIKGLLSNPWIIVLLLVGVFFKLFLPAIKGRTGEGVVNLAAKLRLDPKEYTLLKDVTIPARNGTTQIDHVILSRFGIFVVETKNYSGWIFGDADSAKWTQVCHRKKNSFQNPLRQNYAHMRALSELLELPHDVFHNIVCFIGDAKFKTAVPDGVFLDGRYVRHIKSFKTPLFSHAELGAIRDDLESGRLKRGFKTNREHVRNLKRRKQAPAPVVPNADKPSVNHEKLARGLSKYCRIQAMYWQVDVSQSREFQKLFNGFYRVRRNTEWQEHFYALLERIKTEEMDFAQVLRELYEKTGNIEASFCSKMIATRYPERPVIDRFVLENLGLSLPKPHESDRLDKTIAVYEQLVQRYVAMLREQRHMDAVDQLRTQYPEAHSISDVKALDLMLWQTR